MTFLREFVSTLRIAPWALLVGAACGCADRGAPIVSDGDQGKVSQSVDDPFGVSKTQSPGQQQGRKE